MSEYVIVRINDKLIPEFQIRFKISENTAFKSKVLSWEDIKLKKHEKLILILSANLILTTEIQIPSKSEEVIRKSIPFALEEEIATDVEENHFSYMHLTDQMFLVSVISKKIMDQLLEHLAKADLVCDELYSEIFTIPFNKNKLSLCNIDDKYIVRDRLLGTTIDNSSLSTYLNLSKQKEVVYYTNKLDKDLKDISLIKQIESIDIKSEFLQAITITSNKSINLFQGEYSQNIDRKKTVNPWKKLIILSSILFLSWMGTHIYQIWKLSFEIDKLKNDQKKLMLNVIPNASKVEINDPYSAFQSKLKLTQNSEHSSNNQGFIIALSYLGKTLSQHKNIQVESLRLRDTKLEVKLLAKDVNQLNQFQLNLKNSALTMRVVTGTRDSTQDGISSIITMEQL